MVRTVFGLGGLNENWVGVMILVVSKELVA